MPAPSTPLLRLALFIFLALRERVFCFFRSLRPRGSGRRSQSGKTKRPLRQAVGAFVFSPLTRIARLAKDPSLRPLVASKTAMAFAAWSLILASGSIVAYLQMAPASAPLISGPAGVALDRFLFSQALSDGLGAPYFLADDTLAIGCDNGEMWFAGSKLCQNPNAEVAGRLSELAPAAIKAYRAKDSERVAGLASRGNAARKIAIQTLAQTIEENRLPLASWGLLIWLYSLAVCFGFWGLFARVFRPSLFFALPGGVLLKLLGLSMIASVLASGTVFGSVLWGLQNQTSIPWLQNAALGYAASDGMPSVFGSRMALVYDGPPGANVRTTPWPNALSLAVADDGGRRRKSFPSSTTASTDTIELAGAWTLGEVASGDLERLLSAKAPALTPVQKRAALGSLRGERSFLSHPLFLFVRGLGVAFGLLLLGLLCAGGWSLLKKAGAGAKNTALRLAEQGSQIPFARHERDEIAQATLGDDTGGDPKGAADARPSRPARRL